MNGIFQDKAELVEGKDAVDRLLEFVERNNCSINVYNIGAEQVHFWSNLSNAAEVYKDLSTEFTDLEGLVRKMGSEGFTGFINISLQNEGGGGLLFFMNGQLNGGSYSWEEGVVSGSEENNELLIQKTVESGGTFDVVEIPLSKGDLEGESTGDPSKHSSETITSLEELLALLERAISSNKKIKAPFSKLLKKKFLEKANKYPFLDPFAAEFEYSDQEISYVGGASDTDLAKGVIESVKELAEELGVLPELAGKLKSLSKKPL